LKVSLILLFFVLFYTSFAMQDNNNGKNLEKTTPILIEADKLEFNNKKGVAIYKGNVVVRQNDFTLRADEVYIFLKKDKNSSKEKQTSSIDKIEAVGNVRFQKGEYSGFAEKAEYYGNGKFVKLIGNAKLEKEGNIIEGDLITYYLNTEEAFVSGKNRVRTIIINEK